MKPAGRKRTLWRTLWDKMTHLPQDAAHYLKGKWQSQEFSAELAEHPLPLQLPADAVKVLTPKLKAAVVPVPGTIVPPSRPLRPMEKEIAVRIQEQTAAANRNNVTRTAAYLAMYRSHPELHWAFLAHMVSRNGGWNMTDLKGDLLPRLLSPAQTEAIFVFLEKANNYIFQDAYPQLLLYAESRKRKMPLFHLLPQFHISAFMRPFWERFWETGESSLLTVALIVNEQHYIEHRIVQNKEVQTQVLQSLQFQAQSLLQLNQVVFPYSTDPLLSREQLRLRLAGLVLEQFADLDERIGVGRSLYAILFGFEDLHEGSRRFAFSAPHTGSRADYWPQLFARIKKASPSHNYTERLNGCALRPGAAPLYSPALEHAWPDRTVEPPARFDWFQSMDALRHFSPLRAPHSFDMTNEYCFGLNKVELAILTGEHLLDE
ncbi:DUF2515 domain-containing protein [Paenibacillus gansuensis]|uniref:DUF2515 domain-containing protein n=1 Tax=Paenibacillus gansuensis TaxID=306542 RepID=A0ABW5PHC1_9BACL